MGIKGLLPFLKNITKEIHLKHIKGSRVAVDAYSWLHKAAIICSDKLAMGIETDLYLNYCVKLIQLLHNHDIKIILVFDGKNLPAKLDVENKRHENRKTYLKEGLRLVSENKYAEAKGFFDKCIEISHKIAVRLIKEARSMGVKCIVAPYEADAQLAFLANKNIVDFIITEDSDLLLFGTPKVLFKLDGDGKCDLVEKNDINKVLKFPMNKYSFEKFRHVCILSGCDYFAGIFGVGLITANKIVQKAHSIGLREFLDRISLYHKCKNPVTSDDIKQAIQADLTFQYQVVFDPTKFKQVPLHEYAVGVDVDNLEFLGEIVQDQKLAIELAMGIRDPTNRELVPEYDIHPEITSDLFFHEALPKRLEPTDRRQTDDLERLEVRASQIKMDLPWKKIPLSQDYVANFSTFYDISNISNNIDNTSESEESDDNAASMLNTQLSTQKREFYPHISNPKFIKAPIVTTKRRFSIDQEDRDPISSSPYIKKARVEKANGTPIVASRKQLVQLKLSHLFKKS